MGWFHGWLAVFSELLFKQTQHLLQLNPCCVKGIQWHLVLEKGIALFVLEEGRVQSCSLHAGTVQVVIQTCQRRRSSLRVNCSISTLKSTLLSALCVSACECMWVCCGQKASDVQRAVNSKRHQHPYYLDLFSKAHVCLYSSGQWIYVNPFTLTRTVCVVTFLIYSLWLWQPQQDVCNEWLRRFTQFETVNTLKLLNSHSFRSHISTVLCSLL